MVLGAEMVPSQHPSTWKSTSTNRKPGRDPACEADPGRIGEERGGRDDGRRGKGGREGEEIPASSARTQELGGIEREASRRTVPDEERRDERKMILCDTGRVRFDILGKVLGGTDLHPTPTDRFETAGEREGKKHARRGSLSSGGRSRGDPCTISSAHVPYPPDKRVARVPLEPATSPDGTRGSDPGIRGMGSSTVIGGSLPLGKGTHPNLQGQVGPTNRRTCLETKRPWTIGWGWTGSGPSTTTDRTLHPLDWSPGRGGSIEQQHHGKGWEGITCRWVTMNNSIVREFVQGLRTRTYDTNQTNNEDQAKIQGQCNCCPTSKDGTRWPTTPKRKMAQKRGPPDCCARDRGRRYVHPLAPHQTG